MDDLWGPVDLSRWREVPHMSRDVATESDVRAGRATFYLGNLDEVPAWPADATIPALVLWRDTDSGAVIPAVLIQAEQSAIQCTAGIRFLAGGNGVTLLEELEFVDEDDPRVTGYTA